MNAALYLMFRGGGITESIICKTKAAKESIVILEGIGLELYNENWIPYQYPFEVKDGDSIYLNHALITNPEDYLDITFREPLYHHDSMHFVDEHGDAISITDPLSFGQIQNVQPTINMIDGKIQNIKFLWKLNYDDIDGVRWQATLAIEFENKSTIYLKFFA